jgi:hypothetical protein
MAKNKQKIDVIKFLQANSDVIKLQGVAARSGVNYDVLYYSVNESGRIKEEHIAPLERVINELIKQT